MSESNVTKWSKSKGYTQISFYLPEELRAQFKSATSKNGTKMKTVLVAHIAAYVKENE